MKNDYTHGTEEVLLRVEITDKETGKTANMFFDTFEESVIVIDAMCKAHPQKYSYCRYGGYDMKVIGC